MSNPPPPPPPGHDVGGHPDQPWAPGEPSQPIGQTGEQAPRSEPLAHDQGQQYAAAPGMTRGMMTKSEEKTWSILAHLSAPIAALISAGLLNFVGPLIIWALYKDQSQRVRHASAGAFNFNLSLWIFYAVLVLISFLTLGVGLLVTIPVGIAVWIASMVIHVLAAIKANKGEVYTYPLQIPVLK